MKYIYYYQTRNNENRQGEIIATDRAYAYQKLREMGIRPYRLVGNDPIKWKPWAVGGIITILATIIIILLTRPPHITPTQNSTRRQLIGDEQTIIAHIAENWQNTFTTKLDCHLALYAQPAWEISKPNFTPADIANLEKELQIPTKLKSPPTQLTAQILPIVKNMHASLNEYINEGGTIQAFFNILDERQTQECALWISKLESVTKAPKEMQNIARLNTNITLKDMGFPTIPALKNER